MPFTVKKVTPISTDSLESLGDSVVNLAAWTEDEFSSVASAMQGTEPDPIWNSVPPKPRRGTYAYADGTNWNPGAGEGPYFFNGTMWVPMKAAGATLRNYISGLTVSVSGGTFTVQPGEATDAANSGTMILPAAMTKNMTAWVAGSGNGSLDIGSAIVGTWYHVYLIGNPSTGKVDLVTSTSATGPALPSGYTMWRRIWSLAYISGAVFNSFNQVGDECYWGPPITSQAAVNPGTTLTPYAVTVPLGVSCKAFLNVAFTNSAAVGAVVYLWGGFTGGDPSAVSGAFALNTPVANVYSSGQFDFWTDTSQHIFAKCNNAANNSLYLVTYGYRDLRGTA